MDFFEEGAKLILGAAIQRFTNGAVTSEQTSQTWDALREAFEAGDDVAEGLRLLRRWQDPEPIPTSQITQQWLERRRRERGGA